MIEAVIKSFRPVRKEGSTDRHWSYFVHFLGWNANHDEWVDEENIKDSPGVDEETTCGIFRDNDEPDPRLKELEEEIKRLQNEVCLLKEAEKVSQGELQTPRRIVESTSRSSGARSSSARRSSSRGKSKTEAVTQKRKQPKRDNGDIFMRRNLLLSFLVVDDDRQSDSNGCGVIARRNITKCEMFEDRVVSYEKGPPPKSLDEWRYISVGSGSGYFRLANSLAEMINQPLNDQEANVNWYCSSYQEEGRSFRKVLRIKAMRDINEGEEILVAYRSI